jgi:tRNA pseudouridine55 synthase
VCGGGTYIRSIARDMAAALKTYAAMSSLIRSASGIFTIEKSVKTCDLTKENIGEFIIPTDSVLPFDAIYPEGNEAKKLFNGLSVNTDLPDGTYKIYREVIDFYGLAEVRDGSLKIRSKLC